MKTAVRAAVVLAAVFFGGVAGAVTTVVSTSWYSDVDAANAACISASGLSLCSYADFGTYGRFYYSVPKNGGWDHDEYHFNGYKVNPCTAPEVVQESDGSCVVPPPEVDCSRMAGERLMGKVSNVNQGNMCLPAGHLVDPNAPMTRENMAYGECAAVPASDGSTIVTGDFFGAGGEMLREYTFTGQPCAPDAVPNPDIPSPEDSPPEDTVCMTGSSGGVACLSTKMPKNCGEFNGERICVDSPPTGNCTFVTGSGWACDAAASTPPKPPVPPEFLIDGRGKNGQPATTQVFPKGAEGGDENSTLTYGGSGAGTGEGGSCGGEGELPCKLDEEGTPTVEPGEYSGIDGSAAMDAAVAAAGSGDGVAESATADQTHGARSAIVGALPSSGDCGPIVLSFKGHTVDVDGASRFAPIREGLAWLFGLFAAIYILMLIFRSPSP